MNKKVNVVVELYRIFFTVVIVLHHFRMYSEELPFGGGYMATDFFFVLSGFLLYHTYQRNQSGKAISYFIRRYLGLMIPVAICNSLFLVLSFYISGYRLSQNWINYIKECMLVEIGLVNSADRFNAPMWYLGVMLTVSIVIWILLDLIKDRNRKLVFSIISIFVLVIYLAVIFRNGDGNIYPQESSLFDFATFLRGMCGMSAGVFLALIIENRDKDCFRTIGVVENYLVNSCLILLFAFFLLWRDGYSRFDAALYIMIIFLAYWCFARKNECNSIWDRCICFIGRASFWAYVIHFPIIRILLMKQIFTGLDWKLYSIIYLFGICGLAVILYCVYSRLVYLFKRENG